MAIFYQLWHMVTRDSSVTDYSVNYQHSGTFFIHMTDGQTDRPRCNA